MQIPTTLNQEWLKVIRWIIWTSVQGVDEFDGQDVETEGWRLNSMLWCTCQTSFLL